MLWFGSQVSVKHLSFGLTHFCEEYCERLQLEILPKFSETDTFKTITSKHTKDK